MAATRGDRGLRATAEDMTWTLAGAAHRAVTSAGAAARIDVLRAALPSRRRRSGRARAAADEILDFYATTRGQPPWTTGRLIPTDGDVAVFEAGPVGDGARALVKVAATPAAGDGMADQQRVLARLHTNLHLGDWRRLVPYVLAGGSYRGLAYLLEQRVPGTRLESALKDSATRSDALRSAIDALSGLHTATSVAGTADAPVRARLVGDPISILARAAGPIPAVDRLALRLTTAFDDVDLALGWTHGDYWLGNVLCAPGGAVTGIVDWEYSRTDDVTALDVVNFLLTLRMWDRRQELGAVVVQLLADERWSLEETELLERSVAPRVDREVGIANIVLATWLRHMTDMLERRPDFGTHPLWMRRNVQTVLAAVA